MGRLFHILGTIVAAPIIAAMMFGEFASRILYRWALGDEVAGKPSKHWTTAR